ncbi:hypothetical protein pb186bvf_020160 [Paramecium bursaria]
MQIGGNQQLIYRPRRETELKVATRAFSILILIIVITNLTQAIIFTQLSANINYYCGAQVAIIIQTISYYLSLSFFICVPFSIFHQKNQIITANLVLALISKGAAFILLMIELDTIWGMCYLNQNQISQFITNDIFWIVCLIIISYFGVKFRESLNNQGIQSTLFQMIR